MMLGSNAYNVRVYGVCLQYEVVVQGACVQGCSMVLQGCHKVVRKVL
jgi:hypothetical protein